MTEEITIIVPVDVARELLASLRGEKPRPSQHVAAAVISAIIAGMGESQ